MAEQGPEEVRRAARAFNAMQARIHDHLQERARILAAISHDLQTPITRMKLRVEMADAIRADEIFTVLMGDKVAPRKDFIEQNAKYVQNLDI